MQFDLLPDLKVTTTGTPTPGQIALLQRTALLAHRQLNPPVHTFKVHTIPHTLFAATHLVQQLIKLGHRAQLVQHINLADEEIYIIYGANIHRRLPKHYIVYQTEVAGSHHFTRHYLHLIKNALQVWEYNSANLPAYTHPKTFIVSPGIGTPAATPSPQAQGRGVEVLFYGWLKSSPRRQQILNTINQALQVKIITDKLGPEMWALLKNTRVVLNLHHSPGNPLELFRIHEALSHGCHVVSEGPIVEAYKDYVQFVDVNKPTQLIARLKACTKIPFNLNLDALDNLHEIKSAIEKLTL